MRCIHSFVTAVFCVFALSVHAAQGPVLNYTFNEGSGTTTADVSGNGRLTFDYTPFIGKWIQVALVSSGSGGTYVELGPDSATVDYIELAELDLYREYRQ